MTAPVVREAQADDLPFLWQMLLEATYWDPSTTRPLLAELQGDSQNSLYLAGWGREGDRAPLAEEGGERVGAAWYRLFSADYPGYGFIDTATPELGIAVRADRRGLGVGTALLTALIAEARVAGFRALSLSVSAPNPAMRLYERLGFERVALEAGSWTMLLNLRPGQP